MTVVSDFPKRSSSYFSGNPNCDWFGYAEYARMDLQWIFEGLKKEGKSKGGLANAIGKSPPVVTEILKGNRELRLPEIHKISEYLEVQSPLLNTTASETVSRLRTVSVRGTVQAGVWVEYEDFDDGPYEDVPTVGKWSHLEQFAYKVSGPSMDLQRIWDGDFVIAVHYWIARTGPIDSDIVIVERRRGTALERTVKQMVIVKGGFELWPRSSDPRFQTPIKIRKLHDTSETDGTTVEITGLVIGRWAPY